MLETVAKKLVEATEANTAALHALIEKMGGADAPVEPDSEEPETQEEAPKEEPKAETKKAPAKKAPAKKTAKKGEFTPDIPDSITEAALHKQCATYLGDDEEEAYEEKSENLFACFQHLGADSLGEIDSEEDRVKLHVYLQYIAAEQAAKFREIDEAIAEAREVADDAPKSKKKNLLG